MEIGQAVKQYSLQTRRNITAVITMPCGTAGLEGRLSSRSG